MATNIIMPSGGQTTDGSLITKWRKSIGEFVKRGDVLFEIETDKATLEVESYAEGILQAILYPEGAFAETGQVVAVIGKKDEQPADMQPVVGTPAVREVTSGKQTDGGLIGVEPPSGRPDGSGLTGNGPTGGRILMSPKARQMMRDQGIDPKQLAERFPGDVIKHDHVVSFISDHRQATQQACKTDPHVSAKPPQSELIRTVETTAYIDRPASQMRKIIAQRMTDSVRLVPQYQISIDVDMSELILLRNRLNQFQEDGQNAATISYNDVLMYFASRLIVKYPLINAAYLEDTIREYHHVHFGLAVATDEGLLVPVVHETDLKTISTIACENRENIRLAKTGKITEESARGGTITLSNLGSYGIKSFTAIINQPESTILAVSKIMSKAVVVDRETAIRPIVDITATFDHRLVDGAYGATFMKNLQTLLENPYLGMY